MKPARVVEVRWLDPSSMRSSGWMNSSELDHYLDTRKRGGVECRSFGLLREISKRRIVLVGTVGDEKGRWCCAMTDVTVIPRGCVTGITDLATRPKRKATRS